MAINTSPVSTKETGRVEAFSDGVFAVAITLLVLNIHVPTSDVSNQDLASQLGAQWQAYLAYALSFVTILIMWVSHHNFFRYVLRVDQGFLLINGLLLMFITLVPFPTALVAGHINYHDRNLATAIYGGEFALIALSFTLLWAYASRRKQLDAERAVKAYTPTAIVRYSLGPLVYLLAIPIAFFNPLISIALFVMMAIIYAIPIRDPDRA